MSGAEGYNKVLGNLLGEERFNYRTLNISTCYFDFDTKTIYSGKFLRTLPEEVSIYTLAHECSHSIFTKESEWKDAIKEAKESKKKSFHNFINVVEDIRVEKLMKRKFPGLTRYFNKGARHLYDTDFFGTEEERQRYLLIDKINVLGKVGPSISKEFDFTPEEMKLVKESLAVEDWSQVLEVAEKLYDYCMVEKERNKEKELQTPKQDIMFDYDDEDDDDEESFENFGDNFDDEEDSDEDEDSGLEEDEKNGSSSSEAKEEDSTDSNGSKSDSNSRKEEEENADSAKNDEDDDMKVVSSESAEKNTSRLFEGTEKSIFVDMNVSPKLPMIDLTSILEEIGRTKDNSFCVHRKILDKDLVIF